MRLRAPLAVAAANGAAGRPRQYRQRATRRSALTLAVILGAGACSGDEAARTDVPEPAEAPAAATNLPGTVIPLSGQPEGLVWDGPTATIAAAVRGPGGVVLIDPKTMTERLRIPLAGAARHLQLAAPGGPVLVPTEDNDRLYRISLPAGTVAADDPVGRQPHDAAPIAGGGVFVGDELADTYHLVAPNGTSTVGPAPVQPGGVAASPDGSIAVVVGVRGRRIAAYAADGRALGDADAGVGPTHVRAGANGIFYVADTQGGAVLVYRAGLDGIRQVGKVSTGGGAPYGLAVDLARSRLFVTLTETNELRQYAIDGNNLVAGPTWATVRQPNDVAIDPSSGRVAVAGTADGLLQFIDPA